MTAALVLIGHWLLATVLLVAAVAKVADLAGVRRALPEFGVPAALAGVLAPALVLAELLLAVTLVVPATADAAAWGAVVLFGLFSGAVAVALARGRQPDCRCFGQLGRSRVDGRTLLRNAVLLAVAVGLVLVAEPMTYGVLGENGASALLVAALLVAVVEGIALGWLVLLLWRQQARMLLRIEALESAAERAPRKRRRDAQTRRGLPVGTPAPPLDLTRLDGARVPLRGALASGDATLLVFADPGCGPCTGLLPDVARWQREESMHVIVVSRGAPAANRAMLEKHGLGDAILLQDRFEALEAFEVPGTPAAVMLDSTGRVAAPAAVGGAAIRALAGQRAAPATALQD